MAKRSSNDWDRKLEKPREDLPALIRLRLLKNVIMKTTGKVTGNDYYFPGAGSETNVDERDAEFLLNRATKPCCSGELPSPYFEIVR